MFGLVIAPLCYLDSSCLHVTQRAAHTGVWHDLHRDKALRRTGVTQRVFVRFQA